MTTPSSFSAYGAVDLSSLAQRATTSPAASTTSPGPAPDGLVFAVTEANFESEVIRRSMTVPVVLDLWADWCQPCKQLTPILEKLVADDDGAWVLGTVDVDAEQRLAAAFGVQSVPAVFAVVGGQPVPLFQGALPESQVRQVLDQLLKAAAANGVTGRVEVGQQTPQEAPVPESADPRYDEAYDAVERGDWDAAEAAYRSLLADSPADADAKAGLVQVQLLRRVSSVDPVKARSLAAADPTDVAAQITAADLDVLDGVVDDAFARLVTAVRRTSGADRDAARVHLIELFDLVGSADPRVVKARAALTSALF